MGLLLLACVGQGTVYRVEGEVVEMTSHTDTKMRLRGVTEPTHTRVLYRDLEVWVGDRELPEHEWQRVLKHHERERNWLFVYDRPTLPSPPPGGRAEFRIDRRGVGWRYRVVGEDRRGCQW